MKIVLRFTKEVGFLLNLPLMKIRNRDNTLLYGQLKLNHLRSHVVLLLQRENKKRLVFPVIYHLSDLVFSLRVLLRFRKKKEKNENAVFRLNIRELKHATFLSHGRTPEVYCFPILPVLTLPHLYF